MEALLVALAALLAIVLLQTGYWIAISLTRWTAAIIATAAAQSGSSTPAQQPLAAQSVTVEQAAAMWAPTCRVQCPGQVDGPSAVSCQPMTANACRQVAARNSDCRADLIPANWCASRTQPSAGE